MWLRLAEREELLPPQNVDVRPLLANLLQRRYSSGEGEFTSGAVEDEDLDGGGFGKDAGEGREEGGVGEEAVDGRLDERVFELWGYCCKWGEDKGKRWEGEERRGKEREVKESMTHSRLAKRIICRCEGDTLTSASCIKGVSSEGRGLESVRRKRERKARHAPFAMTCQLTDVCA